MNETPLRLVRYCNRRRWAGGFAKPLAAWLGERELAELKRLRDPVRREQWLQGRWLAKELLANATGRTFAAIEITTRNEKAVGVAPKVQIEGEPSPWRLSLSHSTRGVLAVLASRALWRIGTDLTETAPQSKGFRELWFTPAERAWIARRPSVRIASLWALKESVFKACNAGEPWCPRAIEFQPTPDGFKCSYRGQALDSLQNHVQTIDRQTAAVVYLPCRPTQSSEDQFLAPTLCL